MKKDIEDLKQKIDLSIRRRRYYSDEFNLTICPECKSENTYYNGSDDVTPKAFTNFGIQIRFGHYGCKDCGHTWELSRQYLKILRDVLFQWIIVGFIYLFEGKKLFR